MNYESDGNGGWFIRGVDDLNAAIHLTEEWLTEYERHQGPQHKLRYLLMTGSDDGDEVAATLVDGLRKRERPSGARQAGRVRNAELKVWMKGQRENRR